MPTRKLTVAYDGTAFAGWQMQAGVRTVQGVIEEALFPIDNTRIVAHAAGRTDAGVHAVGQVVSCRLQSSIGCDALQRAMNVRLPPDVRVLRVEEVPEGFNARFAARRKTYRYSLSTAQVVLPQRRLYVWHVAQSLDHDAIDRAAQALLGAHDFAAFQAAGGEASSTRRELFRSSVQRMEDELCYEVRGSGFLHHMVRNIVGTLVDIGRGRRPVEDMAMVLQSRDRRSASATAPPHGLTLWTVEY